MVPQPAYDEFGVGYRHVRRPDHHIQQAIDEALGGEVRVINVGAGTGSYEPDGRCVAAIEPSTTMIRQRAPHLAPAVQAMAENIPAGDGSADAVLAVHTVHHWNDLGRGLAEMRRVAGRRVILTMDPDVVGQLWIVKEYAPEMAPTHVASLPAIGTLVSLLPGAEVRVVPVPPGVHRRISGGILGTSGGLPRRRGSPRHLPVASDPGPGPGAGRATPFGGSGRWNLGPASRAPAIRTIPRRGDAAGGGSLSRVPPVTLTPDSVLLTGRVAVVTGGGSGIGRGVARTLAAFGATVVIWELKAESCASAAEEIGCLGITVDVRDSEQVDAALARTRAEAGDVRILVNNAGGVFWSSFLETSEKGWDALYRANLRHVLLCTQRVARTMVDAGLPGSIMSVTSIEGVRAAPGYAAYAAAKAGVINFTKTVALELAPHGIRVNALAPDITMTEGLAEVTPPGSQEHFGMVVPAGRAGHVDEMGGAAVFLASDLSSYVTGQTLHVDGGTHAASGWYHHPTSGQYVLGPS